MASVVFRHSTSLCNTLRIVITKGYSILSNYSAPTKVVICFFFLCEYGHHIYCFTCVEASLHSWNKSLLITIYNLFDILELEFASKIFLKIFASVFIRDISL
jgi:hypothetical protein